MKKFLKDFYLLLIFLFLYAPIVVLMVFSFNNSKSRRLWNGFTTRWYAELFQDADILHSLYVTLLVAVIAAVLATLIGTVAAIGIHNMSRRTRAASGAAQGNPARNHARHCHGRDYGVHDVGR